jgi:NAD(P)-dependent dehydrogenase (short-subunit alcohol dehydrogenase family)
MDLGLTGQVALVTGASSGIGQAIALAFAAEGVKVAIVGRDTERLQQTVADIQKLGAESIAIQADLTQLDEVKRVVAETIQRFDRINILVNSAGSAMGGPFLEIPDQQWFDAMQLKFFGAVRLCHEVVPHMMKIGGGRIININGGAAKEPTPTFLPAAATNSAFRNFTKGLALSLKQHNILVNAISPGWTLTPRVTRLIEQQAQIRNVPEAVIEKESSANFVGGQMTKPEEIAATALFLASKHVATITGTEIDIDGGTSHGL